MFFFNGRNIYSQLLNFKKGPLAKVWLAAHWERKLSKTQFLQTNIQTSVGKYSNIVLSLVLALGYYVTLLI